MKLSSLVRSFLAATFALALGTAAFAQSAKPKVIGVLFYADWCGSCKVLDPKIEAVKTEFAGQPVLFTRMDFTNDFSKEQSDLLAAALGLGSAYSAQARKTGFMLLIDVETKEERGRLTRAQSEAEIKAAIESALGG